MADITWHEAAAETERSAEEIQQHIVAMEEEISETVDEIGDRLTGTLDWRAQVAQNPLLAVGVAAGLGFLASWMLPGPSAAAERVCGTAGEEMGQSGSGSTPMERLGSILPSLGYMAFMVAVALAQRAASEAIFGAGAGLGASPPRGAATQPETVVEQTAAS